MATFYLGQAKSGVKIPDHYSIKQIPLSTFLTKFAKTAKLASFVELVGPTALLSLSWAPTVGHYEVACEIRGR